MATRVPSVVVYTSLSVTVPTTWLRTAGVPFERRVTVTVSSPLVARSVNCPSLNFARTIHAHTRRGGILALGDGPEAAMKIAQELRECVLGFVEGRISLPDLQLWLAGHVQAIADAPDLHAEALNDEAWILIAEWLDSLRDERSVRAELQEFLASHAYAPKPPAVSPNQ